MISVVKILFTPFFCILESDEIEENLAERLNNLLKNRDDHIVDELISGDKNMKSTSETNNMMDDDNVNESLQNNTESTSIKLDIDLISKQIDNNAQSLLEDCRKDRPKKKVRPPSQLFLKQVILNTPDEEIENVFDSFDNSLSTNLDDCATENEETSSSPIAIYDDIDGGKPCNDDCNATTDIVISPQMKRMFSVDLMDEINKTLSEKPTRNVDSIQLETKTNHSIEQEPPWMKELSNRKMHKTNAILQADVNNINDDFDELCTLITQYEATPQTVTTHEVTTQEITKTSVVNVEKIETIKPLEIKADQMTETYKEDLYVTSRKPDVDDAIKENKFSIDFDNIDVSHQFIDDTPKEIASDNIELSDNSVCDNNSHISEELPIFIRYDKSPIISQANECIRRSREIIMQEFNLPQNVTNEPKKAVLNEENRDIKKFELNELKLSPTTITFVPKFFSANAQTNPQQSTINADNPSRNISQKGKGEMSRTIIYTSKKLGEDPKTTIKKEETTYEIDNGNIINVETKHDDELAQKVDDISTEDENKKDVEDVKKTDLKREAIKNFTEIYRERQKRIYGAKVSVKEQISHYVQQESTQTTETNQPEWLKILRSRKSSTVMPKTKPPSTWIDEIKLKKERFQERNPKIDE